MLLDIQEIADRECGACALEYEMWDRIIEATGNAEWGYRAFEAFANEAYVEFPPVPGFNLIEWESVKIVRNERGKLKAQADFKANERAKQTSPQVGNA